MQVLDGVKGYQIIWLPRTTQDYTSLQDVGTPIVTACIGMVPAPTEPVKV